MAPKPFTWLALATGLALAGTAQAAEVTFVGTAEQNGMKSASFRLEGEIKEGDVNNVKAALAKAGVTYEQDAWRRIVVALDSPGGSFQAGLDLALLFRRQGLATEVRSGDRCFSACALAFLGGTAPPRDPTSPADEGPIPDQPPDRSLEPGAQLGFHAPYLDIPESSYTAQNVAQAYTAAVLGITRFIAIADHLYVSMSELPTLLKPTRDDLYMADTVDAVGFLGINYTDRTLQVRDFNSFTQSMVINACINRYYHLQRRSSLAGYATAASVVDEFIEGSKLLGNGEEKQAFGVRRMKQGTGSTWVAFTPIAKTHDNRSFVWCLFSPDPLATTFYKSAGTVENLFGELNGNDAWQFSHSETTMMIGDRGSGPETWMRVLDMVPPGTKLPDVGGRIAQYQVSEKAIAAR